MKKFTRITDTVNHVTGEILQTSKTFTLKVSNNDEFYMSYITFMQSIFKIKSITDVQVLAKFCIMMEYNTNKVLLPTGRRKELCEELGINNPNLSRSISRLKELNLISGDQGTYEINPTVYWKGTAAERTKLLHTRGLNINVKFTDREEPEFDGQTTTDN